MQEPSKQPSKIAEMFDGISGSYDLVNRILSFGQDLRWRKKMAFFVPKLEHLKLIDIATGTGDQLMALMEYSPFIEEAVGIDLAEKMLEIGKEKMASKSYREKVRLEKGDAENIHYQDNSFDVATISFGIRNVSDVDKALMEMHRVLKPGGKSIILEFSFPKNRYLRAGHLFYLRNILPKLGGLISNSPSSYSYLNKTIEHFPYGAAFLALMAKAGFKKLQATPFAFGAVTLYQGEKKC